MNSDGTTKALLTPARFAAARMRAPACLPYTRRAEDGGHDTWDAIREADAVRPGADEIRLIYSGYEIAPGDRDSEYLAGWTREHAWPKSRGGGAESMSTATPGMGTDLHNLFAADASVNSARSNKCFDELDDWGEPVVDRSPMSGNDGRLLARTSPEAWEPPAFSKGVLARAVLYMASMYADRLRLIDRQPLGDEAGALGRLSVILDWNRRHPPTDREIHRNDVVERFQGNRNPFIDEPQLADTVCW